ncbi:MAG: HupE/UreJ family protein [Pseudomonadota bacterium]
MKLITNFRRQKKISATRAGPAAMVTAIAACALCFLTVFTVSSVLCPSAVAHPEDEFCTPDSGLDPALCRQLAKLDSANGPASAITPLTDEDGNPRTAADTALVYIKIGVGHILPGGTDHILFVLALFLASTRLRSLILQISTFTVAHTITLALAASGLVTPPASIVEPLIALSIAFVAIETIVFRELPRWRLLVVFGFGLFHGLGFAGFIRDVGMPPQQFWSSLIGFNVGVELGQIGVVAAAFLIRIPVLRALGGTMATPPQGYRQFVVIPASLLIALIGVWWAVTRVFE